ncbi:MAG: DUF5916 domain-containing protein [Vicinamibacterales bacterium]
MNRPYRLLAPCLVAALAGLVVLDDGHAVEAGQGGSTTPTAVVNRDGQGRATVRAMRVTEAIRVDGRLDEPIYASAPPASDFVETEPASGRPAQEKTEVWVLYDDDNVYVVARCWESQPGRRVANEMRRDNGGVLRGDHFAMVFDTFFDRRSAVVLNINAVGGRMDGQVAAEGQYSGDWNPVWKTATGEFDGGWTVEIALPFNTLRYRPGREQTWGFNARRRVIWNNEIAYLSAVPAGTGTNGTTRPSLLGTLVGLQAPPAAHHIELKPYAVSSLSTDRTANPRISNDVTGDIGLDAKYGITQSLTANFTLNTDFAQVEADEQQVNLTRFSLFFPEKREFFLENSGLFGFGGVAPTSGAGDVPIMFYSRRIGLNNGREVPIRGGGRLVGQLGRFTVGAINMESGREERASAVPTNFTAVRLKRDILRRSNVGLIFTDRSLSQAGPGASQTYGADATFGFYTNLLMSAYWARTASPAHLDNNQSYRGQLNYNGDRYGVVAERLVVGSGFNPEVGFVRRSDMRKSDGQLRFSPRPRNIRSVRKFSYTGTYARIENHTGRLESEAWEGEFGTEFQNTDTFEAAYGGTYEFLARPFAIAPGFLIPVGGYDTRSVRTGYNFGRQRPLSGNVTAQYGTFYTGHLTTMGVSQGRVNLSNQLSVEPSLSVNWVRLAQGSFTTRLVGSRITYTVTPQMFASALLQYNSSNHAVSANVRLRWEYQPGSEFFVVFNEQRDTLSPGFPEATNRALVVKLNRLVHF